MHLTRTRLAASLAGLAAVAALAGCAGSGSDSDDKGDAGIAEAPAVGAPADGSGYARDGIAEDATGTSSLRDDAKAVDPAKDAATVEPGQAIISTGTISLEAKDVARTRLDVRTIVDRYRGQVTEQETTTGEDGQLSTARLVVRVPSERFDAASTDLEEVAHLVSSDSSGEDVTTEVVDVAARIRAQRASVARVEALLARASNLQQVISIEQQLAQRQADLDSLVSRQKYLADQTALSTITVAIAQEDHPAKDDEDEATGFLGGLSDGWDSFVAGLAIALAVVGFLLPWLLLVALLGVPLWLVLRRRAGRTASSGPSPTPPTPAAP